MDFLYTWSSSSWTIEQRGVKIRYRMGNVKQCEDIY